MRMKDDFESCPFSEKEPHQPLPFQVGIENLPPVAYRRADGFGGEVAASCGAFHR
jgi:hypothetical protein